MVVLMEKVWFPYDHYMSAFGRAQTTVLQKILLKLKYLMKSTTFLFQTSSVCSCVCLLLDGQGSRTNMPLQEVIFTSTHEVFGRTF